MKKKLFIVVVFIVLSTSIYARPFFFPLIIPIHVESENNEVSSTGNRDSEENYIQNTHDNNDIMISSTYMFPIDDSNLSANLSLALQYQFWGIFELVGGTYFEIDESADDFFSMFQTPNVISFGVGVDIPLGGLNFKADYQRIVSIDSDTTGYSDYENSYKIGVGISLTKNAELEFYNRTLFNYDEQSNEYETEGFIGAGLVFTVN